MGNLSKFIPLLALILVSCSQQGQTSKLEKQIAELKTEVDELKQAKSWDDFMRSYESIAYLTPGAEGYSVIQCDLGRMTVSLEDVQAYANGSKVRLRIGNLTTATVSGAKAKIEWGVVDEKGVPKNETTKSREVTFTQSLRPGAWTKVTIVLEGVPPAQLGFVRIRDMTHSGIRLLL